MGMRIPQYLRLNSEAKSAVPAESAEADIAGEGHESPEGSAMAPLILAWLVLGSLLLARVLPPGIPRSVVLFSAGFLSEKLVVSPADGRVRPGQSSGKTGRDAGSEPATTWSLRMSHRETGFV